MVRPKMTLERLDGELAREHFFLHNKSIMADKVRDLSVLTGADVLFLAFSPSGMPTLCLGQHSDLSKVITRFSKVSHNDREKRKFDNIQTLRTNYGKKGYNIDVESLHNGWKIKRLEGLDEELRDLNAKLSDLNRRISPWENLKNISSIEQIKEMEETLYKSIDGMRKRKDQLNAQKMLGMQTPEGLQQGFNPATVHGNVKFSVNTYMPMGNLGRGQEVDLKNQYHPNYNSSSYYPYRQPNCDSSSLGNLELSLDQRQQFKPVGPNYV